MNIIYVQTVSVTEHETPKYLVPESGKMPDLQDHLQKKK